MRGIASDLVFATGHDRSGDTLPGWAGLAMGGATVAVYMGRSVAARVAERLAEAGLAAETPVVVVENAAQRGETLYAGTLCDLAAFEGRDDVTWARTHRHRQGGRPRRSTRKPALARDARLPSRRRPLEHAIRNDCMKALTANRLIDGEVVWLGRAGQWVETLDVARLLENAEAIAEAEALGIEAVAQRLIVEPYLIDLRREDNEIVPVRFRERIRAKGPTTRLDLGKQARREVSAA